MFDDIIKNNANSHEAPVPPDAWDNIVKKKRKRRFVFWWWTGAMILVGLAGGGYFFMNNQSYDTIAAADKINDKQPVKSKESGQQQPTKKDESKVQMLPVQESTAAVNVPANEIRSAGGTNNKQPGVIYKKTKTSITISSNGPGQYDNTAAKGKKNIQTTKGKLQTQQINPGVDELVAANENKNTNIEKLAIAEVPGEEIKKEDTNQPTIAAEDKTGTGVEAEKKTNDTGSPEKTGPLKKANTVAAKQKKRKHWFFEAAVVPLIAASKYNENTSFNRTLAENNSVSVYKANLKNASIEPAVAFSLLIRREMNKKLAVGTGLQYMLLKENMSIEGREINTTYTIVDRLESGQLIQDTVTTITEGTRAVDAVNSYQLFSIPVFVQFNFIQKPGWSVGAVGGFYFNISSNYKNEINNNSAAPLLVAPGTTNRSNIGMDLFAGIRVSKNIGKRLDLFAMPSMRWSLARYNIKNSLLDKNINNAGAGFGLCYKIN